MLITRLTKIDTKLMELVLKCTRSKINNAISKLATKAGNLELEIDVQYACQAKLGKVTKNYPNWKQNEFCKIGRQKCSPVIILKLAMSLHVKFF